MKQAKSEAATVVEKYKAEKEAEFKKKTSSSSLSAENAAMTAETDREIAQMKMDFEKNKDVSGAWDVIASYKMKISVFLDKTVSFLLFTWECLRRAPNSWIEGRVLFLRGSLAYSPLCFVSLQEVIAMMLSHVTTVKN